MHRAAIAGLAKRYTAIHAARPLLLAFGIIDLDVEFREILDPDGRNAIGYFLTRIFHEASWLSHFVWSFLIFACCVYLPGARTAEELFDSKAAISASSGERPFCRISACASSTRR